MISTISPSGAGAGQAVARQLLRRSQHELDGADSSADPTMRFLHAHMAAIRAASALVAAVPAPPRRRRRLQSVWEQLADAGPEWERWAATFATGAPVRAAIEAGRLTDLEQRIADVAVSSSHAFLDEVRSAVLASPVAAMPASLAS